MLTTIAKITLSTMNGLTRDVFCVGNFDLSIVEKYHEGITIDIHYKSLDTNQFATMWDNMQTHKDSNYHQKQYNKGMELIKDYNYLTLSHSLVWNAGNTEKIGKYCSSYEKIGYHACTKNLLDGMIDSGITIFDYSGLWE